MAARENQAYAVGPSGVVPGAPDEIHHVRARSDAIQMPGPAPVLIREASPREVNDWDDMVACFSSHRIVHKLAWIRALEASGPWRPLFLVFERERRVVGCLPGFLNTFGFVRIWGSPFPGAQTPSMGPAFDEERISTSEMMRLLVSFLEERHRVDHLELISDRLDRDEMQALGFRGEPVVTYRVPLFPGDEVRAMRALKDSARRNIKRGVRLGLVPRFEESELFVDELHAQMREVFARRGNTMAFGKRRILDLFRHLRDAGNLVAVSVSLPENGPCIAAGMFTIEGKELMLWQWAHRTEFRWYRPTELMTWTVMQKAMKAGCVSFDLMGGGEFKAKFGAQREYSQLRWVRSRYRWLTTARDLAETCYRWQPAIRAHLRWDRLQSLIAGLVARGNTRSGDA